LENTLEPEIPLLAIYSREIKTYFHKGPYRYILTSFIQNSSKLEPKKQTGGTQVKGVRELFENEPEGIIWDNVSILHFYYFGTYITVSIYGTHQLAHLKSMTPILYKLYLNDSDKIKQI
jgi:hypothetical protein